MIDAKATNSALISLKMCALFVFGRKSDKPGVIWVRTLIVGQW